MPNKILVKHGCVSEAAGFAERLAMPAPTFPAVIGPAGRGENDSADLNGSQPQYFAGLSPG